MNRKFTVFLAALFASTATAALAADLPTRKMAPEPVMAPPAVYDWTGFYIGGNAGIGWLNGGNATLLDPTTVPATPHTFSSSGRSGFVGGGEAGFNYQTGAWVFGVETDIQWADLGHSFNMGPFLTVNNGSNNGGYIGTVRGRLGYAIDRTLIYATGGFAYAGFDDSPFGNVTRDGFAVGGGVEYAWTRNWTIKLEGLFIDLTSGSRTINVENGGVVFPITSSESPTGGLVRVGINYKF